MARTLATYSFGFATYLNVVDSEVIPNNSKRLLKFPQKWLLGSAEPHNSKTKVKRNAENAK